MQLKSFLKQIVACLTLVTCISSTAHYSLLDPAKHNIQEDRYNQMKLWLTVKVDTLSACLHVKDKHADGEHGHIRQSRITVVGIKQLLHYYSHKHTVNNTDYPSKFSHEHGACFWSQCNNGNHPIINHSAPICTYKHVTVLTCMEVTECALISSYSS